MSGIIPPIKSTFPAAAVVVARDGAGIGNYVAEWL